MGRGTSENTQETKPVRGRSKPRRSYKPATVESVLDAVLDPVSRVDSLTKDEMVSLWQQGLSAKEIAQSLNESGFRAPSGRWWPRMVEGELKLILADRGLTPMSASDSLARILARRLGRETLDQIVTSLNANGIKPAKGRWTPAKVMQALEQARKEADPDSEAFEELEQALLDQARRSGRN